ncbi:MAG: DUF1449 family protein [Myxococcales bacterium]|nr:DUF1449 family protein [Myxococcales bacterium]
MSELLEASLAFPSVALTILVGITLLYWVFVILGALDIDIFHVDADIDGAADGVGGGEGGDAGGGHDAADGHDAAEGHDAEGVSSFLSPLGLRRVPLTISLSFIFVIAWSLCLLTTYYLGPIIPDGMPTWLFGVLVLGGSLLVSLPLTAIVITPLAPVFKIHHARGAIDNVGSTCTVTTGHVDHDFGQAKITDNGLELVIPVRCDRDDQFQRHDRALVIDYDEKRHAYLIEPMDGLLTAAKEE